PPTGPKVQEQAGSDAADAVGQPDLGTSDMMVGDGAGQGEVEEPSDAGEEPTTANADQDPVEDPVEAAPSNSAEQDMHLSDDIEIVRALLAAGIEDHEPAGEASSFPAGTKVSLYFEFRNESDSEAGVRVAWRDEANGRMSPATMVRIARSKSHRTRAYRTMKNPGRYTAVVMYSDSDAVLVELPVTITEAE